MPCLQCSSQFTIFKRKRSCNSCNNYYCVNCLSKRDKKHCLKCQKIIELGNSKNQLMQLNTKDLKFFLQSRKINISGIVEKEELCNLIINHLNSNAYYESTANAPLSPDSSTTTPNNDFENYAQSFDHIKQTCQNIFTSITDKIASDFQKTTCFNQPSQQQRQPNVTTQQPRPRNNSMQQMSHEFDTQSNPNNNPGTFQSSSANVDVNNQPSTSLQNNVNRSTTQQVLKTHKRHDCLCSDDEMDEISEKRQSIASAYVNNHSHSKVKNSKSKSSSIESSSLEDDWLIVENQNDGDKEIKNVTTNVENSNVPTTSSHNYDFNTNSDISRLVRHRSDSSLLGIKNKGTDDASILNTSLQQDNDMNNLNISCKKCGKAKTKIKQEFLKLSEQLKSSKCSEDEINMKLKEFIDYLESNHASEMTDNGESHSTANAPQIPNSSSHDEIEENIFDENEGINVYSSEALPQNYSHQQPSCSTSVPKRFISLNDIQSSDEFESMNVKQLKELLMLNRVDFKGCCEKNELKERVKRLWESHVSAPPPEQITSDDLCKVCMDAPIECVFLECGHMTSCVDCGKVLSECPICRSYIVRVVRIFKS